MGDGRKGCDRGRIRMRRKMGRLSSGARIIHLKGPTAGLVTGIKLHPGVLAWQLEDGKCRGNMRPEGEMRRALSRLLAEGVQ